MTPLEEKIEKSNYKYSEQARILLACMPDDFPLEKFEEWVAREVFVIGANYVPAFLEAQVKAKASILDTHVSKIAGLPLLRK